jgi:hypothetical protein
MANLAASSAARRQLPQKRPGKVAARHAPRPKTSMFAEYDVDPADRGFNLPPRAKSALSVLHPPQRAPHDSPLPDGVTAPPGAAVAAWGAAASPVSPRDGEREEPGDMRSKERQVREMERQAAYMEHCADQLEARLRTRIPEDVQAALDRHRDQGEEAMRQARPPALIRGQV